MKREENSSDDVDISTIVETTIKGLIYAVCCCFGAIVAIVFLVRFIFWLW